MMGSISALPLYAAEPAAPARRWRAVKVDSSGAGQSVWVQLGAPAPARARGDYAARVQRCRPRCSTPVR
jgi:hypothetical protein